MRRIAVFILLVFFLVSQARSQEKGIKIGSKTKPDTASIDFDRRIALVIGNAGYENSRLNNPVNDATAIAEVLRKYGFEVIIKTDADRNSINKAINEFGDSITKKKGVSFFYYSGHGLQYKSQNYILPIDCVIDNEDDIEDKAVRLGKVFEKMKNTGNGLNFVILDACRSNPYYASLPNLQKGLTDKETMPGNTSAFFATTPGDVAQDGKGSNSPFTASLVETIRDSIEFFQVVRKVIKEVKNKTNASQQPAYTGSPEDEFYFRARPAGPRLFVLSVGISKYDKIPPLQYPGKDATDMAAVFNRQKGLLYSEVINFVLLDSAATKQNIMKSIATISKQVRAGDVIMLFFSGHSLQPDLPGTRLTDLKSVSYFIPADGDIDNLRATCVDYTVIKSFLAGLPCKSVLFLEGSYPDAFAKDFASTENGVVVFTSNKPGQSGLESAEWGNGLFAKALTEGIFGAADTDSTGFVDIYSLYNYINMRMTRLSYAMGGSRVNPTLSVPLGLSKFRLSKTISREVREDKNKILLKNPR